MNKNTPFSVAMCVFGGDNAQWFDTALDSVTVKQTSMPDEIVLVVDGPIPNSIENVIKKYRKLSFEHKFDFKIIRFETNQGHGNARRASIDNSTNEYIALMDADDIALPDRFENQIKIINNIDVDIVGGNISEFVDDPANIVAYRNVPTEDVSIKEYMKTRCPFNQMSVMFKKSKVQSAGGYLDWYCDEDYYLWIRMSQNGCIMKNTGTVLVNVRVGKDMYRRRGGIRYFASEAKLQKYMLDNEMIKFQTFLLNVIKRFIVQILLPNKIRGIVFKKLARNRG